MKKVMTGALLVLLLAVSQGSIKGVYAWFTSADEQHNYFTTGHNDVVIKEEFPDPEVDPGKEMKKTVEFTNTGNVPCYVRAKYFYSHSEAEEQTTVVHGKEGWQQEADGYYYYEKSIAPGEKTKALITAIKIKEEGSISEDFDVTVYTETVQSENYGTAQEAFAGLKR